MSHVILPAAGMSGTAAGSSTTCTDGASDVRRKSVLTPSGGTSGSPSSGAARKIASWAYVAAVATSGSSITVRTSSLLSTNEGLFPHCPYSLSYIHSMTAPGMMATPSIGPSSMISNCC